MPATPLVTPPQHVWNLDIGPDGAIQIATWVPLAHHTVFISPADAVELANALMWAAHCSRNGQKLPEIHRQVITTEPVLEPAEEAS